MSEKFEKYWTSSNTALAVACFLDPRYKHKLVEFYMRKFYGDYFQIKLDEFISVLEDLYKSYATPTPESSKAKGAVSADELVSPTDHESQDVELESFLYDDCGPDRNEVNELDKYMTEPLLKQNPFDILAYWKNNTDKYPILAQIARDMMAIQVSTVASESAFSGARRVVDPHRNRLDPEMVQALIYAKDWINAASKGNIFLSSSI